MRDLDRLEPAPFNVLTSDLPVLITGGAGFVGSHLCEELLRRGSSVLCLDNLLTGSLGNVSHLFQNERFSFLRHDVIEPLSLRVSAIYNLACPASPPQYQLDPIHTLKTSVIGSLNLLAIAQANRAPIFQASTSEIYGDPQVHPQTESYWGYANSWGPRACYDEGKRCAETLFYEHIRQNGTDARLARIFNTYGPRMSPVDGRVVSSFIVQALTGADITLFGDGRQTRSFCFVSDLVDGFLRIMAMPVAPQTPINLGNPVEITMIDLAETIIAMTGSRSRLVYRPLPQDDPRQRRPDIGLAQSAMDWTPKVTLEEGLSTTIQHFEKTLSTAGTRIPATAL